VTVQQDNAICDLLEGLAAEALSISADDIESIGGFGMRLRQTLGAGPPAEAQTALKFGIDAVSRIRRGTESNRSGAMEDVAAALVAAVSCIQTSDQILVDHTDPAPTAGCFQLTNSDDIDAEILNDFSVECSEHVSKAEAALLSLEAGGDDSSAIDTILRAFHTIKGAAGFMGIELVQNLSHLAEDLLTEAREGKITLTGRHADLVFRTCDVLKEMMIALDGATPGSTIQLPAELPGLLVDLAAPMDAQDMPARAPQPSQGPILEPAQESAQEKPLQRTAAAASDDSVRVSIDRLDSLVNMVGELVISHSMISQDPAVQSCGQDRLGRSVRQAGKIVRQLQELATSMRMVPLRSAFQKVSRAVRELARSEGKNVQLVTSGEDTEIDRHMVEALSDPLIHMIRNAIDHGIESSDDRVVSGKSAEGVIHLSACHSAGRVQIELRDDGRGLDREMIFAKAVESGLIEPEAELSESDTFSMIFEPGLSTAASVTGVSGRGVGMDVVKRNISALHGRVEVASQPGLGATFTISLPLTLAVTDVMAVRVGNEEYLLPMIAIERAFRPTRDSVSRAVGAGELVMYRDEVLPLFRLHRLLGVDGAITDPSNALAIVISGHGRRCAIMVDDLLGHRQTVIKPLGKALQGVKEAAGAAILGDGRVGLILDPDSIVALAMDSGGQSNTKAA
jgi:two-component system, chemotaxis family, sensor kinase CheA